MADGGVTGERLHVRNRPLVRSTDEGAFDTPVLVAERNLQVINLFTVALKTEMSRLDDAGVHGPNRDFMDFVAGHFEKVRDARLNGSFRGAPPGIMPFTIRTVKADRLQPGMALGTNAPLLGNFALEPMRLWAIGSQCGITVSNLR